MIKRSAESLRVWLKNYAYLESDAWHHGYKLWNLQQDGLTVGYNMHPFSDHTYSQELLVGPK